MTNPGKITNLSAARGRKAAVALLQYFEDNGSELDVFALVSGYSEDPGHWYPHRDGPQQNILLEHIDRFSGDRDALIGFTQILTDFVAMARQSCAGPDYYQPFVSAGPMEPKPAMGCDEDDHLTEVG